MYNPNLTRVCLLNVPLENDYKHTLWFNNTTNQTEYFLSKKKLEFTELTYQRKDNSIKVPKQYDELLGCNYVMYQNGMYNSKWFYAFITDIKYISDGVTEIFVETDVIQTWLKDYVVKTSFVEREHSYYDNVGENTYPEQVELGEYVINRHGMLGFTGTAIPEEPQGNYMMIVVGVTQYPTGDYWDDVKGDKYTNVYSAVKYYAFSSDEDGIKDLNTFIAKYDSGHAEAIQCLFLAPKLLISTNGDHSVKPSNTVIKKYLNRRINGVLQEETPDNNNLEFTTNKLDGYTPRNGKLLCFPYRYLLFSNNCGSSVIYEYEQFWYPENNIRKYCEPSFVINGCLTPGCSVRMLPLNYKGNAENNDDGLNMGKFPICNWSNDAYTNWLTQNAVNIGVDITSGILQPIIGGVAMGIPGAVAGTLSGVSQIAGTIGQLYKQSFMPPQVKGNINNGDIITVSGRNDFHYYDMSIKREYARIIDGYFDMFGYKTCYVKVPYTNHRERYWYTKTIDVNIDGAIPNKDLQKIKDAYNNGITFWKNPSDIGNYPYYQNGTLYYSNNVTH